VAFTWRGGSFVLRGGSCYRQSDQAGFNIGVFSWARAPYPDRGFGMWWQPPGRPGQHVQVAESTIQFRGLPEYAGDGTVVIGPASRSGTFRLVGRSTTQFAGKRVVGGFSCEQTLATTMALGAR